MVQNLSSTPLIPSLEDLCVRVIGAKITKCSPREMGALSPSIQDKFAKFLTHNCEQKLKHLIPFYLPRLSKLSFRVVTPLDLEMTLGGLRGNTDLRTLKVKVNIKVKYNPEVRTAGASICEFLKANTYLTSLSLKGSELWRANVPDLLTTFSNLPNLRSLNLHDVALNDPSPETDETPVLMQSIGIIKTRFIAHLNLSGLFFTDGLLSDLLSAIGASSSLSSVALSNNGFSIVGFAQAGPRLSENTHLERLDISWIEGKSQTDNAAIIDSLRPFITNNTHLSELNLNHIGCLTERGIEVITQMETLKRPLVLTMKGQSPLSPEQCRQIFEIKKIKLTF